MSFFYGHYNLLDEEENNTLLNSMDMGLIGTLNERGAYEKYEWSNGGIAVCSLKHRDYKSSIYYSAQYVISFVGRIDNGTDYSDETDYPANIVAKVVSFYGISGLMKLHGDFTVSYVDLETKCVYLYRSEFGGKKLVYFYSSAQKKTIWATSLGQLMQSSMISSVVNEEYIADYLSRPFNSRRRLTPYSNVYHVKPGECIRISLNGDISLFTKDINYDSSVQRMGEQEQVERFQHLFTRAIYNRLIRSTDTVQLFLSGGFDSSSIAYIANSLIRDNGLKNCLLFKHTNHMNEGSELEYAIKVSKDTSWDIQIFQPNQKDSTFLRGFNPDKRINLSEPSPIMLGSLNLNEDFYKQTNYVSLTGLGGDQVVNGTKYRLWSHFVNGKYLELIKGIKDEGLIETIRDHIYEPLQINRNSLFNDRLTSGLFNDVFVRKWGLNEVSRRHVLPRKYSLPRQLEYEEIMLFEQNIQQEGLHHMDTRHPFLDFKLVEFCFSLPVEMKRNGTTKVILKRAFGKYFSDKHLVRGKANHSAQFVHDIKRNQEKLETLLYHSRLVKLGFINQNEYKRILGYLQYGSLEKDLELLKIIELDTWLIMKDVNYVK